MKEKSESVSPSVVSNSLQPHGLLPARFLCPWNFSGKLLLERVAFPSPGDLPHPEIKTTSLEFPAMEGGFFTTSATWETPRLILHKYKNVVFRFINTFD